METKSTKALERVHRQTRIAAVGLLLCIMATQACTKPANKGNSGASSVEENSGSGSVFLEGTYISGEYPKSYLHFRKDGFVYVDYSGIGSDYREKGKEKEGSGFDLGALYTAGSLMSGNDAIPKPNFYKYEKISNAIYINFSSKGYLGLDCSDMKELKELANKSSLWARQ
jgi:hypothetical protein